MKKTLAILLALVLCLSAFVMIACNKCEHNFVDGECTKCGDKDPNYNPGGPQGGNDADVPVVDGKVTFYFTLSDASVSIPSYAGIYFVGGQTGWAEDDAHPFIKLGDTNIYYVQIAYDATKGDPTGYKITLGYNATSGLAADKLGVNWTYQSDECPSGMEHLKYTYNEGDTKVNLGTHTFSTEVSKPERINTTLAVTFLPALPETAEVYIIGSVNDWNTTDLTKSKATADANRETYTLAVNDVICGPHQYKILVFLDGTANVVKPMIKGDDGVEKEGDIWTWQRPAAATQADDESGATTPAEKKYLAYIEISGGKDNLPIDIAKRYDKSTVDLAGTRRRDEVDKDGVHVINARKGLDVLTAANLTEVEGEMTLVDKDGKPILDKDGKEQIVGNGIWATKYILSANKTLTVTFKTALPEEAVVYVIGNFLDSGWATTIGQARMKLSTDRKTASVTYNILPGEYKFNVIVIHKDIEIGADSSSVVQPIWDYGTKLSDSDATVNVTGFADGVVKLFAAEQEAPEVKEPEYAKNVVLKVKFDKAIPADRHVIIAGSFTSWEKAPLEMTVDSSDPTVYTLTVAKFIIKDYECKVSISKNTQMDWSVAWGKDAEFKADKNWEFSIEKDTTEVQLFGTAVLEVPEFKAEGEVTIKVKFDASMEGKAVWIKGTLTGGSWPDVKMTSTDNITFTAKVTAAPGEHKFIIGITDATAEAADYTVKIAGDGIYGGSDSVVVIADGAEEVDLYGTKVIPHEPPQAAASVVFTVTFSEAITGNVFLVGDMTGWSFQKMTKGEGNTYTITLTDVAAKTHGYKIVISPNETTSWEDPAHEELGANAPEYGGANNASAVITSATTAVTLFEGKTLVAPAA